MENTSVQSSSRLSFGPNTLGFGVGPFRILADTDGDIVKNVEVVGGLLHRGIEKIAERTTWQGFLPYMDRVDYLSAISCEWAYVMAVEKLSGVEVPARAEIIRLLVSELNRISSHLVAVANIAQSCGAETAKYYALREREKINDLFEMLCGARLAFNYLRIGGVAFDVTAGFIEKTIEFCNSIPPTLKEFSDILLYNVVFSGRLSEVCFVTSEMARQGGFTGPNLRSSGVVFDLRRVSPYGAYKQFDFETPTGKQKEGGDCFDRFVVRFKEIEQSIRIIRQAIATLPNGGYLSQIPRIFKVPKGEAYSAVEGPRGVFGVYIQSDGEKVPARLKIRSPSLSVVGILENILENQTISDVPMIVASFDLIASEIDR